MALRPQSAAPALADARLALEATLQSAGWRIALLVIARRLALAAGGLGLALLLAVIADHRWPGGLPRAVLWTLGGLWVLAASAAIVAIPFLALLRRFNPLYLARHVERGQGVAHNLLVNLLLVERSPRADSIKALAQRLAERELAHPSGKPAAAQRDRLPLWMLAAASGAWLVYVLITPKPMLPSIARLFWVDRAAPSATRLVLAHPSPDDAVYAGEPLELVFELSGRPAEQLTFEVLDRMKGGAVRLRHTVERGSAGQADRRTLTLAPHEVTSDLPYRCRAGDAELRGVIRVRPQPALVSLEATLTPPPYLNLPASTTRAEEITVWAGTRAQFTVTANTELHMPTFVVRGQGESRTRMTPVSSDLTRAGVSLPLTSSGVCWVEFSDDRGRPNRNPAPWRIQVRADQPPEIEIIEPSEQDTPSGTIDVSQVASLRVIAADDVALTGLTCIREVAGAVKRFALTETERLKPGEPADVRLATEDLGLERGQTMRIWFEGRDNRGLPDGTPAPQVGSSRALTLTRSGAVAQAARTSGELAPPSGKEPGSGNSSVSRKVRTRGQPGDGQGGESEKDSGGDGSVSGEGGSAATDPSAAGVRPSPDGKSSDSSRDDPATSDSDPVSPRGGNATSAPSDTSGQPQAGSAQEGTASDKQREFEEALKQFTEQHAQDATEARQQLAGNGGERASGAEPRPTDAPSAPQSMPAQPPEPQPAGEPAPPPASQPQPDQPSTQDAQAQQPQEPPAPQEQPESPQPSQPGEKKPAEKPSAERSQQRDSQPAGKDQSDQTGKRDAEKNDSDKSKTASQPSQQEQKDSQSDSGANKDKESSQPTPEPAKKDQPEANSKPDAQAGPEPKQESPDGAADAPDPPADSGDLPPAPAGPRGGEGVAPSTGIEPPGTSTPPSDRTADEPAEAPVEQDPAAASMPPPQPELVDVLDLLERAEPLEEALTDLPWPVERKKAFLRDLERLRETAERAGVLGELATWRTKALFGTLAPQPGAGLADDVGVNVDSAQMLADMLSRLAAPPEQQVRPELRVMLEAYYNSLARRAAEESRP